MKALARFILVVGFDICTMTVNAQALDNEQLYREIEKLRQTQDTIQKDIQDIKKLLQDRQPPEPPPLVQTIDEVLALNDAPLKGNLDARLTLMEFSDYQCPFCKRYSETTLKQIENDYISSGKLRYIFRDLPLAAIHKQAQKAAEAAHCAGDQSQYWQMHDKLFTNQKALTLDNFYKYAEDIGLQSEPFKICLESGKYAEKVKNNLREGERLGINGTPTLLLGISEGEKFKKIKIIRGAQPFEIFKKEIDKLLEEQD